VSCRSAVRWRDNQCFDATKGTEYDWMQFFWNVNTVTTSKSSLNQISDIHIEACGGTCDDSAAPDLTWSLLEQGALDYYGDAQDPRYQHWEDTGDATGVDEDQF
jgi:hypothetical protein